MQGPGNTPHHQYLLGSTYRVLISCRIVVLLAALEERVALLLALEGHVIGPGLFLQLNESTDEIRVLFLGSGRERR